MSIERGEFLTEEQRLLKNAAIKQAMQATHNKRKSQICKTYTVKLQMSALSSKQKEQLTRMFLEAKWLWNDILNWSQSDEANSPFNYVISKQVSVKMPNGTFESRELTTLHSQMRQEIQKQICSNIKTLAKLKAKGLQQPGLLRFKSEINKLHIKQLQKNFIRRGGHFVKIPNVSGDVRVNGLNQIPEFAEFACAELLRTPKGYYLSIVTYINKSDTSEKTKISETLGIDFGCQTAFSLSTGERFSCVVEESERLKRFQQKLARQQKGSNNYRRTIHLIQIEYQKLTNKKNDYANKLVHKFLRYETVVIQDEQLHNWHKSSHGKAVQHSVLGRVKAKLKLNNQVVVLSRWLPTSKLCINCGKIHNELKLWDRTFTCDCGISEDRDIHAAKTMIWLNNVGVGRTDFKRVELEPLLTAIFGGCGQVLTMKHEDSSL